MPLSRPLRTSVAGLAAAVLALSGSSVPADGIDFGPAAVVAIPLPIDRSGLLGPPVELHPLSSADADQSFAWFVSAGYSNRFAIFDIAGARLEAGGKLDIPLDGRGDPASAPTGLAAAVAAVPEPESLALMFTGVLMMAFVARRRLP